MSRGGALARPSDRTADVMSQVKAQLQANTPLLAALLPKEITPERIRAIVWTAFQATPGLMKCTVPSVLACVYECCKLGLVPNTGAHDCALVPFRNSKKGVTEATLVLEYPGLAKLMRRAPGMSHVVIGTGTHHKGDHWEHSDFPPHLEHRKSADPRRHEKPILHAYAYARMPDGHMHFVVVDAHRIERARRTGKSTAWATDEAKMWEKTARKDLCRDLPRDDFVGRAIDLDDAAEADRDQKLVEHWDSAMEMQGAIDVDSREPGEDNSDIGPDAAGAFIDE